MRISISTATLFWIPFERALEIIAEAGFRNIELDLFWERKEWAMAQHLKGVSVRQAVRHIERSGLRIVSIHDGGGVLVSSCSTQGFINPELDSYLGAMSNSPECLVFHTPHVEGISENGWFDRISGELVKSLEMYRSVCPISIENIQTIEGYTVPMTKPESLYSFIKKYDLGMTLDTSHYTEIGIDIIHAVNVLGHSIKTIHLSDCSEEGRHVFIGDGKLDLAGLLKTVDREQLIAVDLECSLSTREKSDQIMDDDELIDRLQQARIRLEGYLAM